jgi:hypothetical protein
VQQVVATVFAALAAHWLGPLDRGLWVVLGVPTVISLLYLFLTREKPASLRALKSAHGVLVVLAWFYALAIDAYSDPPASWLIYPFYVLVGASFASMVYSMRGTTKIWYVHFVHIFTASYALIVLYRGSFAFDPV